MTNSIYQNDDQNFLADEVDEEEEFPADLFFEEEEEKAENLNDAKTNKKSNFNPKYSTRSTARHKLSSLTLSEPELRAIFEAKCRDFKVKFEENHYQRFLRRQNQHRNKKVLHMEGSALGSIAAALIVETVFYHPRIVVVDFSDNSLGDQGARCFADLIINTHSIISIDLASNHMTDNGIYTIFTALRTNRSLVSLNIGSKSSIGRNTIGPKSIKEISEMLRVNNVISELNLSLTELNALNVQGLAPGLAANSTLTMLNLSNNNIKSKGAITIIKSIMKGGMIELRLSDNAIQDDIAPYLASLLQNCKSLKILDMSGNKLGFRTTSAISTNDAYHYSIEELILSRNPLGGRGVTALGSFLANSRKIKRINLNGCEIDYRGFQDFCENLARNESLELIEIQHNPLTDDGIVKLSDAIKEHPKLKAIDLEMTELSDKGCTALFEALIDTKITRVSLKNNLIHDGLIIQKALQDNEKLRKLNIEANDIDYKSTIEINRLLNVNQLNYKRKAAQRLLGRVLTASKDAPANVEARLHRTRNNIINERKTIADLIKTKEELEIKCQETKEKKEKTLTELDDKNNELASELAILTDDCRNKNQDARNALTNLENDIAQINARLVREIEIFKTENKTLSTLSAKIVSTDDEFFNEGRLLETQLHEAQEKYRIAKEQLVDAWRSIHAEMEAIEQQKLETERAAAKAALKAAKTARKKKKDKSSKSDKTKTSSKSSAKTSKSNSIATTRKSSKQTSRLGESGKESEAGSIFNSSRTPTTEVAAAVQTGRSEILVEKTDRTFDTQPDNIKISQEDED
ncbi:hypothetical protein TRFO_20252 [Tritrichomonas foetus]|uniref:Leucine Rich Repeat family protein n=1 Tax=Tritrichomonas foetus TaxID=1144522 RepID=A0A1J4KM47_9EUKA|nr:hypothetical protein TRFO_20252 [Tritrichomonas foetus]|eukprot:OHT10445.1 hypothetical protein TRFO_20252 [Tritrichomonas foetus]